MRESNGILWGCAGMALLAIGALVAMERQEDKPHPSLECSVAAQGATGEATNTLTFVAFNVTHWDMRDGTLYAVSQEREAGSNKLATYTLERAYLPGETCREVSP